MKTSLCFVACIVLLAQGAVAGRAKCRRPNGVEGDVGGNGCEQLACTAVTPRKGVWVAGPAM